MDIRAIELFKELERTNTALQLTISERDALRNELFAARNALLKEGLERDALSAEVERLASKLNDCREELFEMQRDA